MPPSLLQKQPNPFYVDYFLYFCTSNMNRRFERTIVFALLLILTAGCKQSPSGSNVDLRLRARIDLFNKTSFINRYHDPNISILNARKALQLAHDSLPVYHDGLMRAYNNISFGYYILAEHDSASAYIDSVSQLASSLSRTAKSLRKNAEVEWVIARLMQIRLLQRSCRIAESYQKLYDINQSRVLKHAPDNYLYSYAQMEYFITSLTLNYHYRNRAIASSSGTELSAGTKKTMVDLLNEVEEARSNLKCDYAEEMSLNYALAHSYYRLAAASHSDPYLLGKAYDYLADNAKILSIPKQFCIYHLANVLQLEAFIAADTNILRDTYTLPGPCRKKLDRLTALTNKIYPTDTTLATPQYGFNMFKVSTHLFFQTPDPYQHLGAVVSAAEYCLHQNAYDQAYYYYTLALDDSAWHDNMAPKFESMLYDGLIRMGYSNSADDNTRWYSREMELLNLININESADLMLQDRLFLSESRNRNYIIIIVVSAVFLILLTTLVILLRHRSKVLRAEKQALQKAKRQDIERIANVETCLSVMRHDINPFLSYLTSKKLSPEMRQEVLEQLLRTFSNIKNWTNLSIPSGLQFQVSTFPLNDVFENVAASCTRLDHDVDLIFYPTTLNISGDRQLTEILLRNLVNNALQHTSEGKVTVYAELYNKDNRFVHIEVDDTGSGMDSETLENLFRADKKVNNQADPKAPNGTGFGLILCKYIIKRHDDNTLRGCRIWAESKLGEGSTFHCLMAGADNENWTPDPWRKNNTSN